MNLGDGVQVVSLVVLCALMIASAMGVVLLQNIVYSAFLLALVFFSMSGMYILLNADFVAAAQILIYVGAVNVLILFAIMLVNKREEYKQLQFGLLRNGITAIVCLAIFGLLSVTVTSTDWVTAFSVAKFPSTLVVIGQHFFSDYLLPFELASVLLLIALIGAIILARREFVPDASTQTPEVAETDESLALLERPREQLAGSADK
ncbi:NADH dehydrogenase subunit J [Thalassoporum mexicanum PCC 7367]|uniref:NADH-quinone oxidoreductase subunit J n=1 Tax=Thalassoporum mexicanum TaxID=3457544 RepID=UPI00029F974C|nr:NADH-quinone oxidoreductase subunit J [Pseudanabaena sp. PCC 7367]AFY69886.1 NADH dehydrogenase subunit J [Pseudanabaena sp. PCC 7367]